MSRIQFPEDVEFTHVAVESANRTCEHCCAYLYVTDTRHRFVWSKSGPTHLIVQVLKCLEPSCVGYKVRVGQEAELAVALPYWSVTWDVFAWIGHRRFARHWSVPQILEELSDRYHIDASEDWAEDYLRCYQRMVAAREANVQEWAADYQGVEDVMLTIDGLQPEKGHETLYVVRELRAHRVWFAEPLLSSSTQEVQKLFERAARIAKELGKPVRCWMSDKQDAFVKGVASVFPDVPHRYCANHFLRDLAKPVLEADSHAKVQMRTKVRGLRDIEKRLLQEVIPAEVQQQCCADAVTQDCRVEGPHCAQGSERQKVVFDYCQAVRGILNNDQGGPITPPGLRMANALKLVAQSIAQCVGDDSSTPDSGLRQLQRCIERGLGQVCEQLQAVELYSAETKKVFELLDSAQGSAKNRKARFTRLAAKFLKSQDPIYQHMGRIMQSFGKGLFAGGDDPELPVDNLELERAFRLPKSHERRIHGHAHAGVRIVRQGASLMLVLDAHCRHPKPFEPEELAGYADAPFPDAQLDSERRRRIMRLARSSKQLPLLLAELEARYRRAAA